MWNFYYYDSKSSSSKTRYAVGELMGKVSGLGSVYKIKKLYDDASSLKLKTHIVYNSNVKGKSFSSKKR